MSDSSRFKENVRSDSFWIHTLYLVMFLIISRVLDFILFLTTLVQWVFRLLSGEGHGSLTRFSMSLGIYYQQVVHFLTGSSEVKPFPFSDWPATPSVDLAEDDISAES